MPRHLADEKPLVSGTLALYALMAVIIAMGVVFGLVARP